MQTTITTCDGCDKKLDDHGADGSATVVAIPRSAEPQERYDLCGEACFAPAVKRRRDAQAKAAQAQ